MTSRSPRLRSGPAALLLATAAFAGQAPAVRDPLAAEIERWSAYRRVSKLQGEIPDQVRSGTEAVLKQAADALRENRRFLAFQRVAAARRDLSALVYMEKLPAGTRRDDAGFEKEWERLGKAMRGDLGAVSAAALEGVRPAAIRAICETALPQVRGFYDASLEYGRNTMPDSGYFYLGAAQAQRDLPALCRDVSAAAEAKTPPTMRSLRGELESLDGELVAAYRPPAAIDRHADFIFASSLANEARQLDEAGLRYGALMRYLQAAQRVALLRAPRLSPLERSALTAKLSALEARLRSERYDHTLGRFFLESAEAELAHPTPGADPATATAIAADVLPRYFAALAPAARVDPRPDPRVTVTLVRWPYT